MTIQGGPSCRNVGPDRRKIKHHNTSRRPPFQSLLRLKQPVAPNQSARRGSDLLSRPVTRPCLHGRAIVLLFKEEIPYVDVPHPSVHGGSCSGAVPGPAWRSCACPSAFARHRAAASAQDPTPYIQNALASLANSIAALHARGARKFLLLNVPNLARSPSVQMLDQQVPGAALAANQLTQIFNAGLVGVLQYANGLGGTDARGLDLYGLLEAIAGSPQAYGFDNTTDACVTPDLPPFHCAGPDRYVFWDGVHPTRAVHALIAQQAIAVMSAP